MSMVYNIVAIIKGWKFCWKINSHGPENVKNSSNNSIIVGTQLQNFKLTLFCHQNVHFSKGKWIQNFELQSQSCVIT